MTLRALITTSLLSWHAKIFALEYSFNPQREEAEKKMGVVSAAMYMTEHLCVFKSTSGCERVICYEMQLLTFPVWLSAVQYVLTEKKSWTQPE